MLDSGKLLEFACTKRCRTSNRSSSKRLPLQHSAYPSFMGETHDVASKCPTLRSAVFRPCFHVRCFKFLARVDSRCAEVRATDPSNKSRFDLQPRIGSYIEMDIKFDHIGTMNAPGPSSETSGWCHDGSLSKNVMISCEDLASINISSANLKSKSGGKSSPRSNPNERPSAHVRHFDIVHAAKRCEEKKNKIKQSTEENIFGLSTHPCRTPALIWSCTAVSSLSTHLPMFLERKLYWTEKSITCDLTFRVPMKLTTGHRHPNLLQMLLTSLGPVPRPECMPPRQTPENLESEITCLGQEMQICKTFILLVAAILVFRG